MIPETLLAYYGSIIKQIPKDTFLWMEGEQAAHYYQIKIGKVKMLNINEDGKEFVQGVFEDGQSFGEPPLMQGAAYPASAMTLAPTKVYKLSRERFFDLLKDNFDIHLSFTSLLTKRLMYKAMIMKEISNHDAGHRILTFIDHLKEKYGQKGEPFEVNFTRQQLSEMLGLRVETVIRTIKQLEKEDELKIIDRKVIR
jgi:CRP-like cAMP-binding protein